jgi:hypothetical protein
MHVDKYGNENEKMKIMFILSRHRQFKNQILSLKTGCSCSPPRQVRQEFDEFKNSSLVLPSCNAPGKKSRRSFDEFKNSSLVFPSCQRPRSCRSRFEEFVVDAAGIDQLAPTKNNLFY